MTLGTFLGNSELGSVATHVKFPSLAFFRRAPRLVSIEPPSHRRFGFWGTAMSETAFFAPPRRTAFVDVAKSVFFRKFMSGNAVSFTSILSSKAFAAHRVDIRCHRLKMHWVHANDIAAKMVGVVTARFYNAYKHFIGQSVCAVNYILNSNFAIAIFECAAYPKPAWSAIPRNSRNYSYVLEKVLDEFEINRVAVSIVAGHRDLLQVNDGLGDVRLQPCAAFSL